MPVGWEAAGRTFEDDVFASGCGAALHAFERGRILKRDGTGRPEDRGSLANPVLEHLGRVALPPEECELDEGPVEIERHDVADLDRVKVVGHDPCGKGDHHVVVGGRLRPDVEEAHVAQHGLELINGG